MSVFNLNADMAESYGPWVMGNDDALLPVINSANIACGFHAGDYNIMVNTMRNAAAHNVSIGAHPGFYDLHGFGRRQINLSLDEIEHLIAYQLGAALGAAALAGAKVTHVKPHGALNNMAATHADIAKAIARAIKAVDATQIFLAPVLSELVIAGEACGLTVAQEIFADRAYMPDGQLAPRSRPDAMIHDPDIALAQSLSMLTEHHITAIDGTKLAITPHSLCVHGDGPSAVAMAKHLQNGLIKAGLTAKTLPDMML
ncbi:MAG: 5-oxoprolinase subunit PxpA [Pseudomonadota bacterium]|nr:5-oxoprolinase subunit PxpA [Pseudomonadota bacterium]